MLNYFALPEHLSTERIRHELAVLLAESERESVAAEDVVDGLLELFFRQANTGRSLDEHTLAGVETWVEVHWPVSASELADRLCTLAVNMGTPRMRLLLESARESPDPQIRRMVEETLAEWA